MANILPREKQIAIISALTEGCSIRATERMTGVHRDTIMRLGVRVGNACTNLHDRLYRNLVPNHIQLDEMWSFVGMKQKLAKKMREREKGDQYLFMAMDAVNKSILSYKVGKRTEQTTLELVTDLKERVVNRPHISSDAFMHYRPIIEDVFGNECQYGQITKVYRHGEPVREAYRRYSPGVVVAVNQRHIIGHQPKISTSHIERTNLTVRMQSRRFTRLTSGFSKKLENHKAAVGLAVAHYNLCRPHETIGCTPAMAVGLADQPWSIADLLDVALDNPIYPIEGRRYGRFTIIDGGADA